MGGLLYNVAQDYLLGLYCLHNVHYNRGLGLLVTTHLNRDPTRPICVKFDRFLSKLLYLIQAWVNDNCDPIKVSEFKR